MPVPPPTEGVFRLYVEAVNVVEEAVPGFGYHGQ
jgi:hypothetical protein